MLKRQLQELEKPFSHKWISDFITFMSILDKVPEFKSQIEKFQKEKFKDQKPLMDSLNILFCNGKIAATIVLKKATKLPVILKETSSHIQKIINFSNNTINDKESLYFDPSRDFNDFTSSLRTLTHKLIKYDMVDVIHPWVSMYCPLNVSRYDQGMVDIKYTFSESLEHSKIENEKYIGKRDISYWRKWEILLQWKDYLKNGLPNTVFHENILNMFSYLKIKELVQDIGCFFMDELRAFFPKRPILALELYLDRSNQYWILVHRGKDEFPETYHIKRLYEGKALNLIKQLLDSSEQMLIKYDGKLTKDLGDLYIKKEIAKVFFSEYSVFSGGYVELGTRGTQIDQDAIMNLLHQSQAAKKRKPSFDKTKYYQNSWFYNKPK